MMRNADVEQGGRAVKRLQMKLPLNNCFLGDIVLGIHQKDKPATVFGSQEEGPMPIVQPAHDGNIIYPVGVFDGG